MIFSDVEDEDTRSTHEQPAELHDAPFGSDGVYQYEKKFERDEDGVQINDDEEVQSLVESDS